MGDPVSIPARKVLVVRLPAELHSRLEEMRAARSKAAGKRMSLRALVEEILNHGVAAEGGPDGK